MVNNKLPKSITAEEFKKLITKLRDKDKEAKVACLLAYASGLRVSEVKKLQPENIRDDLSPPMIEIKSGKGNKDRQVPLPKGWKDWMKNILPIKKSIRSLQRNFETAKKRSGLNPEYSFHCVSEDTEILTKEGWKNLNQLSLREKVFSYNIQKDIIEDDFVLKINKFKYNNKLINIKNRYLDCLFSYNHLDLMNVAHIKTKNNIRVSSVWDGWKLVEINKFLKMPNKRLIKKRVSGNYYGKLSIGKERAGLLGWILTDGCISKRYKKSLDITITQSYDKNRKKCEIIKHLLLKSGTKYSMHIQKPNKTKFNPNGRMAIFCLLSKDGNNSWVLDYLTINKKPKLNLLTLKNEELKELYEMMMLGDGSRGSEFCCQDKEIINFFQILCLLINKRCLLGKGMHNITGKEKARTWICNKNNINVLPRQIKQVEYSGTIWCPTTKNKTWIAKRNGKVFITGNSLRHGFAVRLLEAGVPANHVQALLGHTNLSTTSIYTRARPIDAIKSYEDLF